MGLISELRRRNVFRMAVLYVVAAWLVVQVATALIELSVLPDNIGPWAMALLAIGFPIALVVSWFFDVTTEGIVRDADVPEGQPMLASGGRRTDFVIIAMLAAAIILMVVWEPPASGDDALTVLPFDSMTGPDEASFAQGVSIELLNLLAQLRKFKVKQPPEASILARFPDTQTLAGEMDVRWVLQGSVRRDEQRVRIAVQLIDADDDASIAWSNVFDRELTAANLFGIQTEIARSITSELNRSLDEPEEQRLAAPPTENMEAYTAYLIGRDRLRDRKVAELADAVELFSRAIELDPDFAGPYSGLADACFIYQVHAGRQEDEKCPPSAAEREQLARKAIELDPDSGEAWISLGSAISRQVDGSPESMPRLREAIAAYERGLELNPYLSQGYHWYALALMEPALYPDPPTGWAEAWEAGVWQSVLDKGLEVDPLSIQLHYMKVSYPIHSRSKEEAIRHAHRIVEIAPDSPRGYERLAEATWEVNGRIDEFIRWQSKAMEIDPSNPAYPAMIGQAYATLGDVEMALAWFDRAMQIISPQGNERRKQALLVSKARAWLGSKDESSVAKAKAILDEVDPCHERRIEIEASFVDGAEQASALLEKYAEINPECVAAEIDEESEWCPHWVDRLDQILGAHERAQRRTRIRLDSVLPWYEIWPDSLKAMAVLTDLALLGRQDEALGVLEGLVKEKWRGDRGIIGGSTLGFQLYHDITLDAIRDHPRFQALVAEIEADLAQQLENVREMESNGELPTLEELREQLHESTN